MCTRIMLLLTLAISIGAVFSTALAEEMDKIAKRLLERDKELVLQIKSLCPALFDTMPIQVEKIDENKLPVVSFFHRDAPRRGQAMFEPNLRQEPKPRFYVVLWSDGRIIWGKLEADIDRGVGMPIYMHSFSNAEENVVYFQSRISTEKVEILVSEINKLDIWEDSGAVLSPFHVGSCFLFVQNDNQFFSFVVPDINWPRSVGSGSAVVAKKWERVARLLLELIPCHGEKIDIKIKEVLVNDKKLTMSVISISQKLKSLKVT